MDKDKKLDIPFLLCKCGNLLSSDDILGEYIHELQPSLISLDAIEAGKKRKKFFRSKNLHRLCCWQKIQTYFDPIPIALLDVKRL